MKRKASVYGIIALLLSACATGDDAGNRRSASAPPEAIQDEAPLEILASAMSAVRSMGSVHVVSVARLGNETVRVEGTVGSDRGVQMITVGDSRSEIHFIEAVAYVRSNKDALTTLYGFSSETASRYAEKWLAFTSGDQLYARISRGLTIDSMIQDLMVSAPLTKTPLKMIGQVRTIGVSGKTPEGDAATVYVSLEAEHLPVQIVITRDQEAATIEFDKWGTVIAASVPSSATRASELAA